MRVTAGARWLALAAVSACAHADGRSDPGGAAVAAMPPGEAPPARTAPAFPVEFERDVRPIVARCQPCHFPGGAMYQALPFDRAETIRRLGPKLFTRIKGADEQAVVRRFLSQPD